MCSYVHSSEQVTKGSSQSPPSDCDPVWTYLPPQHLVFFASCNFWKSHTLILLCSISLGGLRTRFPYCVLSLDDVKVICDSFRFQLSISITPFATSVIFCNTLGSSQWLASIHPQLSIYYLYLWLVLVMGETEMPIPTPHNTAILFGLHSIAEQPTAHHFLEPTVRGS